MAHSIELLSLIPHDNTLDPFNNGLGPLRNGLGPGNILGPLRNGLGPESCPPEHVTAILVHPLDLPGHVTSFNMYPHTYRSRESLFNSGKLTHPVHVVHNTLVT